jgi:hypothetical protein
MPTLSDIALRVQNKLEEPAGGNPPVTGNFWDYQREVFPAVVEASNEANLIAGTVIAAYQAYIIPPNTTYLSMPKNALALMRVVGLNRVKKYDVFQLDNLRRGWENETGEVIEGWFSMGFTQWGVFPRLTVEQRVVLTYIAYPVAEARPYSGNEVLPFQDEYYQSIENYAAHILRMKEAGQEFEISQQMYQEFLSSMQSLSRLQARRDNLVFAKTMGATLRTNIVESK